MSSGSARSRAKVDRADGIRRRARALGDGTRFEIYRYISSAPGPVGVAELAERIGLHHTAVRQHLAKLREAGLVTEGTEARSCPGRPRLEYRAVPARAGEIDRALTPNARQPYEDLALMLMDMLRTGSSARDAGRDAGRRIAVRGADPVAAMERAVARQGFEPTRQDTPGGPELVLGHCPYESAARADPSTICELHLGVAEGMAEGSGVAVDHLSARDPRRAGCRLGFTFDGDSKT